MCKQSFGSEGLDPICLRRADGIFPFSPKLGIRPKYVCSLKRRRGSNSSAASQRRGRRAAPTIVHSGRMTAEVKRISAAAAATAVAAQRGRSEVDGRRGRRPESCVGEQTRGKRAVPFHREGKKKEEREKRKLSQSHLVPAPRPEDANCSVILQ